MTDTRTQILNRLYLYSKLVDAGDFEGVGELFKDGCFEIPDHDPPEFPGRAIGTFYSQNLRRFEDGTPHTTHVNPNVILDIDESAGWVQAWTSVLVFQLIESQICCIFSGSYDDTFERVQGLWVWRRRVSARRLVGDMSHHLLTQLR